MTLADYLAAGSLPPTTDALILDTATRDAVMAAQATYGDPHHQMQPVLLTDGRWGIGADVLSEANGLFAGTFQHLPNELAAVVEVVTWEEFQALLPAPEPIERVRARDAEGRFIADDPSTPDVDEAWVP